MARVGISGHRVLAANTTRLVEAALRDELASRGPGLTGFSCLADGADTIFAQTVLDSGGRLEVLVPAKQYRDCLPSSHHATYDRLLAAASQVHRLPYDESNSESHMAASARMLDLIGELVAVWDGKPARGYGGTADVVAEARRREIPIVIIWPDGAERD